MLNECDSNMDIMCCTYSLAINVSTKRIFISIMQQLKSNLYKLLSKKLVRIVILFGQIIAGYNLNIFNLTVVTQ